MHYFHISFPVLPPPHLALSVLSEVVHLRHVDQLDDVTRQGHPHVASSDVAGYSARCRGSTLRLPISLQNLVHIKNSH